MINKIYNFFKKGIFIIIIYLLLDIIFFSLLPENIKSEFYNNRAHRIKSYYYHHDLRPNASFYDVWGYEKYKIHTNNLGFKDKNRREIKFKDRNILFIGDSFTEGVGLKFEDTYVGKISETIKKLDNNVEILNAGVQSYSPGIYLAKIYDLIERKNLPITDIVIMISGGDIADDYYKYLKVDENFRLQHTDQSNKFLIKVINFYKSNTLFYQIITRITPPKVIPELIKSFFNKEKNKNYLSKEIKLLNISNKEILKMEFLTRQDYEYFFDEEAFNNWGKKAIAKSINNLKRIIKLTEQKNIKLKILYAKEPVLIIKKPKKKILNYILLEFKKLEGPNVKFYYINEYHNIFDDNIDGYKKLFFIGDIHWNKKGSLLVANEIINKLNF